MADTAVASPRDDMRTRERLIELAKPKEYRSIWITETGPSVMWGTQDTLWPMSQAALRATPSPRVHHLATPKRNFQMGDNENRPEFSHSCGRSSVIWQVSPHARQAEATPRLATLSRHKPVPTQFQQKQDREHYNFGCGRTSPIWKVTPGALQCPDRQRTTGLARPKTVSNEYQENRQVATIIPRTALTAEPSPRIHTLADPKNRQDGPFRDPQWPVAGNAISAVPTPRNVELAKAKGLADGYLPARDVIWDVPRSARHAVASTRLGELSQPIVRATMDHVQFDPDAFLVKQTALKARCSKRLEELSVPLQR